MATIYSAPEEIAKPVVSYAGLNSKNANDIINGHQKAEADYIEKLKAWCKKNSKGRKNVGELIKIQHADSYALYIVFDMKPLELIHVPVGDEWDSPYAELLTPRKVNEMIEQEKRLAELFSK